MGDNAKHGESCIFQVRGSAKRQETTKKEIKS